MQKIEINLVPKKEANELKIERWLKKLKGGSVRVLAVYVGVLILVFGTRLVLSQIKSGVKKQEVEATAAINSLSLIESQHTLVKDKLRVLAEVFKQNEQISGLLQELITYVGANAQLTGIDSQQNVISMTVQTGSLQELYRMLSTVQDLGSKYDFVKEVSLESVDKEAEGQYTFRILLGT